MEMSSRPSQSFESYISIVNSLEDFTPKHYVLDESEDEYGVLEERILCLDGIVRPFFQTDGMREITGIQSSARARIVGHVEEGMGIAIVLRPFNPFKKETAAFFIQPEASHEQFPSVYDPDRGYTVFRGEAEWPKRKGLYWGADLLLRDTVRAATNDESIALIDSIRLNKMHRKPSSE